MSRLKPSLDDSLLRSQLFDLKQSVDTPIKQLIDKVLSLSSTKLLILFTIYSLEKSNSKEVAEKIFLNRSTVAKRMGELAEQDGLLSYVQSENNNPLFPGVKTYFVSHESTKMILGFVTGAIKPIDSSNHEQNGTLPKVTGDSNLDTSDNPIDNKQASVEQIHQFYQGISDLPPTSQKIISLLDDTPKSVKHFYERIGCDYTTASKYLKKYWDLGIAHRKMASSPGTGRGEFLYYLNPDVFKVLPEVKNQFLASASSVQAKFEGSSDVVTENTAVSASNEKTCNSSDGANMSTEPSQPADISVNTSERSEPLAHKIKEFIKQLNQVEKTEQELRDLLGPGKETDIAIARLKSKNL
ncbi:hypothetical protein NUACC21_31070 [Scytonema sp. NUACC21]